MKKLGLSLLFLLVTYLGYAQLSHVELLMGKTEAGVRHYLDSLNKLKSNSYYKVNKDVSEDGDLILKVGFSIDDEQYYNCLGIITLFQRTKDKTEICAMQRVWGSAEYAQANLTFLKDNFTFVSNNTWEKPFGFDIPLKVRATFEKLEGTSPKFVITYELVKS